MITIGSGIGSAAGSWAAGWIFDMSGSYRLAFILSIAAYVCGCIAFWALRRPPARSGILCSPEIDQLAHRRAGFQRGKALVDLVELDPAGDQVIELQPALPPQ